MLDGARTDGAIWSDEVPHPRAALRPYHREAVQAVLGHLGRGRHRATVIMPTGTGKSVLLEAILLELRRARGWRRAIVVVKVPEEQFQTAHRLRDTFHIATRPVQRADVIILTTRQLAASPEATAAASLLIFSDLNDVREGNS